MAASGDEQFESYTTINNIGGSSLINLDVTNNAALNVASGTLTIQPTGMSANPGVSNSGSATMAVSSGAKLVWNMSQFQGTGLSHPGAAFYNAGTVTINDGGTLAWDNPTGKTAYIGNDGSITLGSSTGATLQLTGGGTFDVGSPAGTGSITMNAHSSITGTGSETFINDTGHTIQGTGTIGNLQLQNNGTIDANSTGSAPANVLSLQSASVTNNGLMEATNNGVLELSNSTVNNGSASIVANGGTVLLNDSTIVGGALTTLNGGTIELPAGSFASLVGTTNTGNFGATGGGGQNTFWIVGKNTTFPGGGAFTLNTLPGGGNAIVYVTPGSTVGISVQGEGVVGFDGATINAGTINANSTGSGVIPELVLSGAGGEINGGLLEATNSGVLVISGEVVGSNITASGPNAIVYLNGASIQGGILSTTNGGILGPVSFAQLDGATNGPVTLSTGSTYFAGFNSTTFLSGTINNQGTFQVVGGSGTNTFLEVSGGTTSLKGGGTVNLITVPGGGNAGFFITNGGTLNNVDNTIQGTGIINTSGGTFNNGGTIIPGYIPGASTAGTISVTGNYNQTGGVYEEYIGNGFGLMNVSGNVTLGGSLTILLGYDPANGSTFNFVTFGGSLGGGFTITDPFFGPGNDQEWVLNYLSGAVQLEAEANNSGPINATWSTGSGSWTDPNEWSCSPPPSNCVPNNGSGNVYDTALNSPKNTLKLTTGNSVTVDTLALTGGTLNIQSGASLNLANQPNGIIDIPTGAGLDVAGTFEVSGGPTSALANLSSVEGTLTLEHQTLTATPVGTLSNSGSMNLQQTTALTISGGLANAAVGKINLGNGTSDAGRNSLTVTGLLTNDGTITLKAAGDSLTADLANSGSINLNANDQTLNDRGDFINDGGGSLNLKAEHDDAAVGGNLTNNSDASVKLSGTNESVSVTGTLSNNGTITVGGTGNTFAVGTWSNLNAGTLSGGSYDLAGQFQYTDDNNGNSGVGVTGIGNGTSITLRAGGLITYGGSADSLANLASNAGTLTLVKYPESFTPGTGTFDNSGTMNLQQTTALTIRGNLTNLAGGSINLGNGANDTGQNSLTVMGTLTNDGTIKLNAAGDSLTVDLTNAGTMTLNNINQTLSDSGDFANSGTVTIGGVGDSASAASMTNSGGSVFVAGGAKVNVTNDYTQTGSGASLKVNGSLTATTIFIQGGTVSGSGDIDGNVINSGGTIDVSDPGTPTTLTINGNYQEGPNGTLIIDITGANAGEFSVLAVTGMASLDGTLDINFLDGFTPAPGEMFPFLTYGSLDPAHEDFSSLDFSGCPNCAPPVFEPNGVFFEPAGGATPEPSALTLFGTALVGIAGYAWRSRRRASR